MNAQQSSEKGPLKKSKIEEACSSEDEHDFTSPLDTPTATSEQPDEFHDSQERFHNAELGSELKPAATNIDPDLCDDSAPAAVLSDLRESSDGATEKATQASSEHKPVPAPLPPRIKLGPGEITDPKDAEDTEALNEAEQESLKEAEAKNEAGKILFKEGKWQEALDSYKEAIRFAPIKSSEELAKYHSNASAANIHLKDFQTAIKDATTCLRLRPKADIKLKALVRRAQAYEETGDIVRAYQDHEMVVSLATQGSRQASDSASAVKRLKPKVDAEQEKTKEEMIAKLKELGNTVLGKFGMSLDNFKAEKDPATGQYSISMQQ